MMGTNRRIPVRATRAREVTGATSRLGEEAVFAGSAKKAVKESQTVLITLLSCRV